MKDLVEARQSGISQQADLAKKRSRSTADNDWSSRCGRVRDIQARISRSGARSTTTTSDYDREAPGARRETRRQRGPRSTSARRQAELKGEGPLRGRLHATRRSRGGVVPGGGVSFVR